MILRILRLSGRRDVTQRGARGGTADAGTAFVQTRTRTMREERFGLVSVGEEVLSMEVEGYDEEEKESHPHKTDKVGYVQMASIKLARILL